LFAQPSSRVWVQAFPAEHPPQHVNHAMAYDAARQVVVLFGGYSEDTMGYYGTTWTWNGQNWSLANFAGPGPRIGASMVYDDRRGVCVLVSGGMPDQALPAQDTWEWNGVTWSLVANNGPARRQHALAYDKARGRVVLFGGYQLAILGPDQPDTWEWDGQQWLRVSTDGPAKRFGCALAYDEARGEVVLFGGYDPLGNSDPRDRSRYYGDTWAWNGTAWTQRAETGPSARSGHNMVYDTERRTISLFGGSDSGSETWEWNGSQWSLRSQSTPPARLNHGMAYDTARREVLLYGGSVGAGTDRYETWRLTLRETWVDFAWAGWPSFPETGDFGTPFNTLAEGVSAAPTGSIVQIKSGSRNEPIHINKALYLRAYGGPVRVGP
jgi:hypothetical protein